MSLSIAQLAAASSSTCAHHAAAAASRPGSASLVRARACGAALAALAAQLCAARSSVSSSLASASTSPTAAASLGGSMAPPVSISSARRSPITAAILQPQCAGTAMPSATSLSPMVALLPLSSMTRRSQHSARAQPPAGHAPPMAAATGSGERRYATRHPVCARQKRLKRASDVEGACSSLMSLPAVNMSRDVADATTSALVRCQVTTARRGGARTAHDASTSRGQSAINAQQRRGQHAALHLHRPQMRARHVPRPPRPRGGPR